MIDYSDRIGPYMEATDMRFYPQDFRPEDVSMSDIARGLSTEFRFAGHTKRGRYTVAQHSVSVTRRLIELLGGVSETNASIILYALLHDASEAYIRDMPRPIKIILPDYQRLEKMVQSTILKRFDIEVEKLPMRLLALVKEIDNQMMWCEAERFRAFDPRLHLPPYMEPKGWTLQDYILYDLDLHGPLEPKMAEVTFLRFAEEIDIEGRFA